DHGRSRCSRPVTMRASPRRRAYAGADVEIAVGIEIARALPALASLHPGIRCVFGRRSRSGPAESLAVEGSRAGACDDLDVFEMQRLAAFRTHPASLGLEPRGA